MNRDGIDEAAASVRLRDLLMRPRPDFVWDLPAERLYPRVPLMVVSAAIEGPIAYTPEEAVALARMYTEHGPPALGMDGPLIVWRALRVVGRGLAPPAGDAAPPRCAGPRPG